MEYLIKVCSEELQIPCEYLDMSPESLKYIWKWFLSIMKVRKTPIVRLQEIYRKFVITINKEKEFEWNKRMELSSKTRDILQDIAMYFGEVIVKNNPKIYWSYYGEQWEDVYNNYPVLKGFIYSTELEGTHRIVIPPQIYVDGEAAKVLDGDIQSEEDLIELYKLLCEHIPQ